MSDAAARKLEEGRKKLEAFRKKKEAAKKQKEAGDAAKDEVDGGRIEILAAGATVEEKPIEAGVTSSADLQTRPSKAGLTSPALETVSGGGSDGGAGSDAVVPSGEEFVQLQEAFAAAKEREKQGQHQVQRMQDQIMSLLSAAQESGEVERVLRGENSRLVAEVGQLKDEMAKMSEVAGLFGGGTDERISQLEAQLAEAAEQLSTTLEEQLAGMKGYMIQAEAGRAVLEKELAEARAQSALATEVAPTEENEGAGEQLASVCTELETALLQATAAEKKAEALADEVRGLREELRAEVERKNVAESERAAAAIAADEATKKAASTVQEESEARLGADAGTQSDAAALELENAIAAKADAIAEAEALRKRAESATAEAAVLRAEQQAALERCEKAEARLAVLPKLQEELAAAEEERRTLAESIAEVQERRMHEKAALEAAAAEQPEEAGSSENRLSAELRSALQAAEERTRTAEIDLEQANEDIDVLRGDLEAADQLRVKAQEELAEERERVKARASAIEEAEVAKLAASRQAGELERLKEELDAALEEMEVLKQDASKGEGTSCAARDEADALRKELGDAEQSAKTEKAALLTQIQELQSRLSDATEELRRTTEAQQAAAGESETDARAEAGLQDARARLDSMQEELAIARPELQRKTAERAGSNDSVVSEHTWQGKRLQLAAEQVFAPGQLQLLVANAVSQIPDAA